ncbi:MAG: tRNA (adenosine(37)-N6)-threonylcarbamoyltransferase complex transferase subunit TsaD [Patescibacteria group bacterium]
MKILSIETSCDETAAAVVDYTRGGFTVLSNVVSSQINIHKKFGGVVPEVAARKQLELIIPVIEKALAQSFIQSHSQDRSQGSRSKYQVSGIKESAAMMRNTKYVIRHIDALAVTVGPGLQIALSVGVETARTLAAVWHKPIVAVNHLEGHLYSALLPTTSTLRHPEPVEGSPTNVGPHTRGIPRSARNDNARIEFPAIGLIVSGGHTELILIKDYLKYKLLGRTRDDAAGEAYDKVAKLLGLSYPGGPAIDRLARHGNPAAFDFPRGMMQSGDYDFSFSGLKTAVLYTVQKMKTEKLKNRKTIANLCASFQAAVVDVLVAKTIRAATQYHAKTILLGGGVAANSQLRKQLAETVSIQIPDANYLIPHTSFTTDNAAMIAVAAVFHAQKKDFTPWQNLRANPSLALA